jgi:tRNA/tmRNA/rRNA uracil-C5-methylase (TrmA/RlmC/RlmD family)
MHLAVNTFHLPGWFEKVAGIDLSQASILSAKDNAKFNGID